MIKGNILKIKIFGAFFTHGITVLCFYKGRCQILTETKLRVIWNNETLKDGILLTEQWRRQVGGVNGCPPLSKKVGPNRKII